MISYADLLTLLLAVFVVLYAESASNTSRQKAAAASMMEAFSGTPPAIVNMPSSPRGPMRNLPKPISLPVQAPPTPKTPFAPKNDQKMQVSPAVTAERMSMQDQKALQPSILAIKKLRNKLSKMLAPEITHHTINILSHPISIKIRLNAKILFKNGQASLTHTAVKLLTTIGRTLSKIPAGYIISIRGYTDNVPINTVQFPSNWQLSTSRALSVLLLFRSVNVSGNSLSVEGFSKYHALSSNKTKAGRALNRRISIVITAPKSGLKNQKASNHEQKSRYQATTGPIRSRLAPTIHIPPKSPSHKALAITPNRGGHQAIMADPKAKTAARK